MRTAISSSEGPEKDYYAECDCGWVGPARETHNSANADRLLHLQAHNGAYDNEKP